MKLPRPAHSYDSQEEFDDDQQRLADLADAEAQAADDAWSDRED